VKQSLPFPDRRAAATELSEQLRQYEGKPDTLVLALVRGGIVLGRVLSDALTVPLFPYIVRKIGHPHHREYGLGAIAEGGATYFDEAALHMHRLTKDDLTNVIEEETRELQRRKASYAVKERPPLAGKTVILTDDGAATGGTLFAAIKDLRQQEVTSIVVALPVCPPDTAEQLRNRTDEAVILATPEPFDAVGKWYRDFPQVEDVEVLALLQ
jgi:putative phosphoribosyl transferase